MDERARRARLTTLANAAVAIARAGATLVTTALIVRHFGREAYGVAAAILALAGWLGVAQFGTIPALRNEVIRRPEAAGALLSGSLLTLFAIGVPIGVGVWFTGYRAPLLVALLAMCLSPVRAVYSARQAEYRLAPGLLVGIGVSVGLSFLGVRGHWSFASLVAAAISGEPIGLLAGLAGLPVAAPRRLFRPDFWFFSVELSMLLIFEADILLVNLIAGPAASAVYAIHAQLFAWVQGALALVITPWWAAFGDAWRAGEHHWLRRNLASLAASTAALAIAGCVAVLASGKFVLSMWTGGKVPWNFPLAGLLAAGVVVQSVTGVYSTALGALNIVREPARVVFLQGILNVLLCAVLVREFGAIGAAAGSLITFALTSALYIPRKAAKTLACA